jgi:hypothetical protein
MNRRHWVNLRGSSRVRVPEESVRQRGIRHHELIEFADRHVRIPECSQQVELCRRNAGETGAIHECWPANHPTLKVVEAGLAGRLVLTVRLDVRRQQRQVVPATNSRWRGSFG